jgi:RHS repeat-associated protein
VVYRAEFDPHGQQLYEWASGGATFLNSHKFTGYERDWATNLDYAKARSYTRYRGRFLQPDPLGVAAADVTNPQSLNRYGYVGNDPVNFVDPSGLNSEAPPIRIETWEPGPWWNYFIWMLLFGWGGGGGGHQPIGGGGGGGGDQGNPELPFGPLPPQEEINDPCESQILRNFTNIELARTGLNKFIQSRYVSQNGNGYIVRFNDPVAARAHLERNFNRLPGILGSLGAAYHKGELQAAFPGTTGLVDYRGANDPIAGTRSLQVVTLGRGAYVDTDRYNPYQDILGFVGHNLIESLFKRGDAPIKSLCEGR